MRKENLYLKIFAVSISFFLVAFQLIKTKIPYIDSYKWRGTKPFKTNESLQLLLHVIGYVWEPL